MSQKVTLLFPCILGDLSILAKTALGGISPAPPTVAGRRVNALKIYTSN